MADQERIERILHREVERTRELYKAEAAKFENIRQDIPSGLPSPDGVTRIRQAADSHNQALATYMAALKRFNDYAIRRIIPDDL